MEYKISNDLPYTNRSWLGNETEKILFTIEINLTRNVPKMYTNKIF